MKLPTELTVQPTAEATAELAAEWAWLVPSLFRPRLFSSMGDVFYEEPNGGIHWLSTESGTLRSVASSRQDFEAQLKANIQEWFSVPLLDAVLKARGTLSPGQVFGFKRLPVLGGSFTPENVAPYEAREWYGFTGTMHRQIKHVPDGGQVDIEWTP